MATEETKLTQPAEGGGGDKMTDQEAANAGAPPPAYEDGPMGKIQKARDESSGTADFICRVFSMVCCGTICFVIYIAIMLCVPVAEIVIGAIYLDDCPIQKKIPIYLIVMGCFRAVKAFIHIGDRLHRKCKNTPEEEDAVKKGRPHPFDGIVSLFLFAWFICGTVWVYGNHKDYQWKDENDTDTYCNRTVYLFAFWIITVHWIFIAVCVLCSILMCLFACFCTKKK